MRPASCQWYSRSRASWAAGSQRRRVFGGDLLDQLQGRHDALWRDFPYAYELDKLPIDVINGSELLREWVDNPAATPANLDALLQADESTWREERESLLLYCP